MIRHQEAAWRRVAKRLLVLCCVTLPAAVGRGETAQWIEPTLDTWMYTNSITSGTREFAPSFGALGIDEATDEFFQGGATGATRLGMAMVAFETIDQIEAGLDPSRYAINSVTVTGWATSTGVGDLLYSEQPYTPASLLDYVANGGSMSQLPVELFGVGFTDEYDGFDLGLNTGDSLFSEASKPYSDDDFAYDVYPVVGDGASGYSDVSNNLTGGFSYTATGQQTDPFEATAWAIGDGFFADTGDPDFIGAPYNEGDVLPTITRYEFELDLTLPGVDEYVREGLADGSLGFILSSLHNGAEPGTTGGGAYIDWRMKEAFADFSSRLEVDFTILTDSLTGDADGDGDVDGDDLIAVQTNFGLTGAAPLLGDADGDGDVDGDDLIAVQTNFGATAAVTVPEPSAAGYAVIGLTTAAFCWGTHAFTAPRRERQPW